MFRLITFFGTLIIFCTAMPIAIATTCVESLEVKFKPYSSPHYKDEGQITLNNSNANDSNEYLRSDRTMQELLKQIIEYPASVPFQNSKVKELLSQPWIDSKNVLDIGCGNGAAVMDLRKMGANANGLDIFLNSYQKSQSFFIESDARKTDLESGSFDFIYSAISILTYPNSEETYTAVMKEMERLLVSRGYFLIIKPSKQLTFSKDFELIESGERYLLLRKVK